jgi:PAS domain S-box-containing protein
MKLTKGLILVVDDDPTIRIIMEQTLVEAGYNVLLAENGLEAEDVFNDHKLDLVILDVQMPKRDGYELCSLIREKPQGETLPILMMTSLDDMDSVYRAFKAGATDFISKPINWAALPYKASYLMRSHSVLMEKLNSDQVIATLGRVLDNSSNEIYHIDANTMYFVQANRCARDNLGYNNQELSGYSLFDIINSDEDSKNNKLRRSIAQLIKGKEQEIRIESNNRRKDGSTYPMQSVLYPDLESTPASVVCIGQDVSEQKRAEQRMYQLAYYDDLTGLPNRQLFHENFHNILRLAERRNEQIALLFVDLDNFKYVNDSLGY